MDFHSLTRKELQSLCKKNKIPANLTNVAMADALQAIQNVEGLEEFLNQSKSDPQLLPEDAVIGSPDVPPTSCRTLTRRKPIKEEPESLQPLTRTRRGTRRGVSEEAVEQERNEIPKTPAAARSTHRRTHSVSVQQQKMEESSVQRVYSTRRSVRLLEKTLEKLSLTADRNIQPVKMDDFSEEIVNDTEKTDGSSEKGAKTQSLSEESSGKTEDLPVPSELKSNESSEIQIELENDVQENTKSDVLVVEKSKSDVMDEALEESSGVLPVNLVEKSDETMDGKDETKVEKELGDVQLTENSYAAQNSSEDLNFDQSKELNAVQDLATDSLAAAEKSDDVSTEVDSSARKENEFSIVKESGEPVPLIMDSSSVQTDNLENESNWDVITNADKVDRDEGNHGSKVESFTEIEPHTHLTLSLSDGHPDMLASNATEMHVKEDDYHGKFDFESESVTAEEEESDDDISEKEVSGDYCNGSDKQVIKDVIQEDESGDESSEEESEETDSEASLFDVDVIEEEVPIKTQAGDDSSEEEYEDSEASDEEDISQDLKDISDDEVESEETDSEASLVDVDIIEAEVPITTQVPPTCVKQESACAMISGGEVQFSTLEKSSNLDDETMKQFSSSEALVDVCVSAEEFNKTTGDILSSGSKVSSKSPLPPFAADQLAGQFPRPALLTPSKSSSKTHPVIQIISEILDENEENIEEGGKVAVLTGEDEVKKNENATDEQHNMQKKLYAEKSLRQLRKMLKDVHIENKKKDNKDTIDTKVEKTRIALQTLPENRMAVDETQNEN